MSKSTQTERKAYSIPQFCEAYGISRSKLYVALKKGEGPRIMKFGGRTLISVEAAEAWRVELEAHSMLGPCRTRNHSDTLKGGPKILWT